MIEGRTEFNQNVTGDNNFFTGTGDINYTTYRQASESSFYEPNLTNYAPPKFVSPQVTEELRKSLYDQYMVLLGGSIDVEKLILARHLAWYLREFLIDDKQMSQSKISIYERDELALDALNISEIEKLKSQAEVIIFILPRVTRQNTSYDLNKFSQMFREAPDGQTYYAILITDNPCEAWRLNPDIEAHFWEELSLDRVYSVKNLSDILSQKLRAVEDKLPKELKKKSYYISQEGILCTYRIHRKLAVELKKPARIDLFVQLLLKRMSKADLEVEAAFKNKLYELLKTTFIDNKVLLKNYFDNISSSDDKLFALGLSLFYGLFELQFFEVLNKVVRDAWHRDLRDTGILDYYHLDQLQNFFKFDPITDNECLVESLFNDQRRLMLEIAWESHRMHIAATLPTLVNMIKESMLPWISISNQELYKDLFRRTSLRSAIIEIISQIGELSVQTVESSLLELAKDPGEGPKNAAALALAKWHRHGKSKQLFEFLLKWQKIGPETAQIAHEYNLPLSNIKVNDNVQLTIAKAVNYAAQYNVDSALPREMCELLRNLATHESSRVRKYFASSILKNVFPPYLVQLKDILEIAAQDKLIRKPIVEMLAETYENGSQSKREDVIRILGEWADKIQEYKKKLPKNDDINDENGDEEETYSWELLQLTQILAYDRIGLFDTVRGVLPKFLTEAAIIYKLDLVDMVIDIYLNQRRNQKSASSFIIVNDQKYPTWIDGNRPFTDIEVEMLRWVTESYSNKLIYKIILLASIGFACKLESYEKEYAETTEKIDTDKEEGNFEERSDCHIYIKDVDTLEQSFSFLILSFIFFGFISLLSMQSFSYSHSLILFVLAANAVNSKYIDIVLDKWVNYTDNKIKLIGVYLKFILWVVRHVFVVASVIVLLVIFIILLLQT